MKPESWAGRLLEIALTTAASVFLLRWSWTTLQPLLPVLVGLLATGVSVPLAANWFRNRADRW